MIRITGAEVTKVSNPKYNNGNLNYQLVIRKNTVVTLLKKERINKNVPSAKKEANLIDFENFKNENGYVSK